MDTLYVYFNGDFAGILTKENKNISFTYDNLYAEKTTTLPLSASLPKQKESFSSDITESFFQSLLPDEGIKKAIARILQTDETNTFRILEELGGDCAGAIYFSKKQLDTNYSLQHEYRKVNDEDAYTILSSLKKRPLYIGEEDFRVSGAGAQSKLVACIFDNTLHLPLNGTPSTHIIKPNIDGYENTTYNELFCMKLARLCGLETPECFIKTLNREPYYVVARYDRELIGTNYTRIHQEDFCQALGILPENKYESDGGPSLKDCFNLLQKIGISGKGKIDFLDRIIFNYLIGNTDAHGKNFSILYKNRKAELAPCYDLLCTEIISPFYNNGEHNKVKMAMKLGSKKYMISKVTRENFEKLTDISGFRKDYILKRVDAMCKKIIPNAKLLRDSLNEHSNTESPVYTEIIALMQKHVEIISL